MKINLKQLSDQKTQSTNGSKKMTLSENAASMVFQLFTKNVYSNPIGTVVREITSNCFDSHVEARVDTPVIIKRSVDNETGTHYVSFIDFGVGMSPKRVEEVYMVYFESTKRVDNTQIGGFGIGGKTPLAYKRSTGLGESEYDNSFYVITTYNGIKYYYCIFEGEDSPEVTLLHEEETTDHNGTEVRIPVLETDMRTFEREMIKQLYYFENIIYEGFEEKDVNGNITRHAEVSNDYQIVRGKSFLFRGDNYDDKVHVCLGRVAYPIDYSAIDEQSHEYQLPVAIKLEVGDINVTASREQLDYSDTTIKMLKKKLKEVKAELTDRLKDQYSNVQTLKDYFEVKDNFGSLQFPNGECIHIGNVIKKEDVDYSNFKYSHMSKVFDDSVLFDLLFTYRLYGKKEKEGYYSNLSFKRNYKGILNSKHLYYVEGEFNRKIIKQALLKSWHERYYIIKKKDILTDDVRLGKICDALNVELIEKMTKTGKPISFISSLIELQEEYFQIVRDNAENYDEIEVPEEFILERKREKLTAETLKTTIPVKFMSGYYRTGNRPKIQDLVNHKGTVVYGFQDDERAMRNAYDLYNTLFNNDKVVSSYNTWNDKPLSNGIMFILIAKNNERYMEYCSNAYHVREAYWKLFHRKADFVREYFMTYALQTKYNNIEGFYRTDTLAKLSSKWGNVMQEIKTYMESLPEKVLDLHSNKYILQQTYDIENIELNVEQKAVLAKIDAMIELQNKNAKTLSYINLPYRDNEATKELLLILAKVMSF